MRKILVIGGSSGIGLALCKELSDNNLVTSFSRTKPEFNHQNLNYISLDVLKNDLPDLEELDSLIYCPGSINLKPITRLSEEDFLTDFNINVIGAVKAIKKYLPLLKKGFNPSIILFSSVATKLGMPFHASIAASKSAVEGLVKSLGAELAPKVRVNGIAPTITDTPLASKLLKNDRFIESTKERHPLKNYLQPNEVSNFANYLQSEKANAISGQIFNLDYGIVSFKI